MTKKRKWTYNEEQFLIDNFLYITVDEAASALDRTKGATARKIYDMQQKNLLPRKRGKVLKDVLQVKGRRSQLGLKDGKIEECPECGSRRINELEYAYSTGAKYFCVNCLSEFDKYGKWIRPIL